MAMSVLQIVQWLHVLPSWLTLIGCIRGFKFQVLSFEKGGEGGLPIYIGTHVVVSYVGVRASHKICDVCREARRPSCKNILIPSVGFDLHSNRVVTMGALSITLQQQLCFPTAQFKFI